MDFSISMETKDAHMATQGHWRWNWANRPPSPGPVARAEIVYTFKVDQYRPPYGRALVAYPRRCVFVGTINREGEYLKGQTGNTRFLPWLYQGMAAPR